MEMKTFLTDLEAKLLSLGIAEDTVKKRVGQFERYLSTLTEDEVNEALGGLGGVNEIAANIALLERGDTAEISKAPEPEMQSIPEEKNEPDIFADIPNIERRHRPEPEPEAEDETKYIDLGSMRGEAYAESGVAEADVKNIAREEAQPHIELDFNELDIGETEIRPTALGRAVFIGGCILTLPITLPLAVALFLIIGGVFAALSVLIFALIAALVAIVVVGVAIPLIGIIFGIVKCYTVPAEGIYEIGIGIAIAGICMFTGILVYNLAVRLLPFVMKKFGVFSKFVLRCIGKLIAKIRRRCITL